MEPTFWPTTLQGWLAVMAVLAAAIASVVGAVWAAVRRPIINALNGLGKRVEAVELAGERIGTRMDAAERSMQISQMDRTNLHESVSRLSTEMQTLVKVAQSAQLQRAEDLGEIRERLVRIETKVDRNDSDERYTHRRA